LKVFKRRCIMRSWIVLGGLLALGLALGAPSFASDVKKGGTNGDKGGGDAKAVKVGNPHTFDIQAGQRKVFRVTFTAGDKVEVWITSKENTDIDLFVKDQDGKLIVADTRDSKDCYVTFVPRRTQTYRLEVLNIGKGSKLPVGPNRCTLKWLPKDAKAKE
jgi:hypothetical protein